MKTNYKKGLLSVATAMALMSSSASANYIPLTSSANDNHWVLFGVNGFQSKSATNSTLDFEDYDNGNTDKTHLTASSTLNATVDGLKDSTGLKKMASVTTLTSDGEITINFNSIVELWNILDFTRVIKYIQVLSLQQVI